MCGTQNSTESIFPYLAACTSQLQEPVAWATKQGDGCALNKFSRSGSRPLLLVGKWATKDNNTAPANSMTTTGNGCIGRSNLPWLPATSTPRTSGLLHPARHPLSPCSISLPLRDDHRSSVAFSAWGYHSGMDMPDLHSAAGHRQLLSSCFGARAASVPSQNGCHHLNLQVCILCTGIVIRDLLYSLASSRKWTVPCADAVCGLPRCDSSTELGRKGLLAPAEARCR